MSPPVPPEFDAALIGGGFSGAMTAVHLLGRGARVALIERSADRFARGTAYSTTHPEHLLNVPAGRMTAFPEDPGHLVRWESARRGVPCPETDFLSRAVFGAYLNDCLARAEAAHPGALIRVTGDAVALATSDDGGHAITLADGRIVTARGVGLALGNFPPSDPLRRWSAARSDPRYVVNPWASDALAAAADAEEIVLLGSGLTAVDVLATLAQSNRAHRITIVSRRGLLPRPHGHIADAVQPPFTPGRASPRIVVLLREFRDAVRRSGDWRAVVDSLRPHTAGIWGGLPEVERRRFLRHAAVFWDAHRHRVPGESWAILELLRTRGVLHVLAGRIARVDDAPLALEIHPRGGGELRRIQPDLLINCTGPDPGAAAREPLVAGLIAAGLARPGPLGIGLDVDADGFLLGANGIVSPNLLALGPLRRGCLWESIAVPELRGQCVRAAEKLMPGRG